MTPAEVDTLLEDAALLNDRAGVQDLYDGRALVVGPGWVGGPDRALELLAAHVAGRLSVLDDVAVSVTPQTVTVFRRGTGRAWLAIVSVSRAQRPGVEVVRSDVGVTGAT